HMMRFGAIVAAGAAAWLGATPGHELFEQLGRRSNPSLLGLRPVRANDVPTVPAVQRSSMAFSGKACHLYTVASQSPGYSFGGTGQGVVCRGAGAGPRRRGGQAPGLEVSAGTTRGGVAEDQAPVRGAMFSARYFFVEESQGPERTRNA